MRRFHGDSDDDDDDEGSDGEDVQPSPMDISRGTATPHSGPGSTGRLAPWITDEQEIIPSGRKPDWMTKSQEPSPAPTERQTKRALRFEEETQEARLPEIPSHPTPSNEEAVLATLARAKGFRETGYDLYAVSPFGDVDFARLAREQAEMADRLGRPRPSDKFLEVATEHPSMVARLERVLHNMLSRNPTSPVMVLYASEPDLDERQLPTLLWRSAPGRSHLVVHLAVIDHRGKTRLDTRLALDGPASIGAARVDLFREASGSAHVHIRSDEDQWVLEAGTFLPAEPVVIILIQENPMSQPQALELQPLRFDQARIQGKDQG